MVVVASAAAAVADVKAGHFRSYDSSVKTLAKGEKPKPDNATFVHLVLRSEVGGAWKEWTAAGSGGVDRSASPGADTREHTRTRANTREHALTRANTR